MDRTAHDERTMLPKPSASQLAWQEMELGLFIHFDMFTFRPDWDFRTQRDEIPPPEVFNPRELDTDQWIQAAVSLGARYAVLTAKHCSGSTSCQLMPMSTA